MTLTDMQAYHHIIGDLMVNPLLLIEYPDITPLDFDYKVARVCFVTINNLYREGAKKLTPLEVDQEVAKYASGAVIYNAGNGLEFLKSAFEIAEVSNFDFYYKRLKKYSLLRRLKKEKYDISEFYIDDSEISDPLKAVAIQERFNNATLEDILNGVEGKYTIIRNDYLQGGRAKGDPAEGISKLIDDLQKAPNIGPSLEGDIFSSACRGAREGCFFLKSASTNAGKSRTSVYDACRLCYPERWSMEENCFIQEIVNGELREPRKVLFIVTEMDKEEIQTIMLSYLSGVDEDHILTGAYEIADNELKRVKYAAKIIEKYSGYFIIEEISDPNLNNVEATVKKYATIDHVKYVIYDYIHTTGSMMSQFERAGLREDTVLMLMANQLKQVAKDYNVFMISATQVNALGMSDELDFKNETCIRGSKAVADKCDVGWVMTRISEKMWNAVVPTWRAEAMKPNGIIDPKFLNDENWRPTHVLDIYKMRRGRYKNVRIWTHMHLGTGYRHDLFMTTADNQPIRTTFSVFHSAGTEKLEDWESLL